MYWPESDTRGICVTQWSGAHLQGVSCVCILVYPHPWISGQCPCPLMVYLSPAVCLYLPHSLNCLGFPKAWLQANLGSLAVHRLSQECLTHKQGHTSHVS